MLEDSSQEMWSIICANSNKRQLLLRNSSYGSRKLCMFWQDIFLILGIHSKIGKSFLVDVITKAASRNLLYYYGFPGYLWTAWSSVAQVTSVMDEAETNMVTSGGCWLAPIQGSMVRLEVKSSYTFEAPMVSALHKILWVPGWVAYKVMSQKTKIYISGIYLISKSCKRVVIVSRHSYY